MKDARKHSQYSLWPRKLLTILLATAILMGFTLVACSDATGSQETRVADETAGLGQAAAAPVAATSDQDESEPQPALKSDIPLVSNNTSDAVVSLVAKPGRDVGELAYSFTLPSVSGSAFSLDAQRGDKNVVVVFYRAFW